MKTTLDYLQREHDNKDDEYFPEDFANMLREVCFDCEEDDCDCLEVVDWDGQI